MRAAPRVGQKGRVPGRRLAPRRAGRRYPRRRASRISSIVAETTPRDAYALRGRSVRDPHACHDARPVVEARKGLGWCSSGVSSASRGWMRRPGARSSRRTSLSSTLSSCARWSARQRRRRERLVAGVPGLREGGSVLGALCLYLKTDSYGEYVFDWEWAHAYQAARAPLLPEARGRRAVHASHGSEAPRAPGRRRHGRTRDCNPRAARRGAEAGRRVRRQLIARALSPRRGDRRVRGAGFAVRHSLQFHWRNRGYGAFSDYLGALEGKRRRQIARERRQLGDEGLEIERLTGRGSGRRARRHHVPVLPLPRSTGSGASRTSPRRSSPRSSGRCATASCSP